MPAPKPAREPRGPRLDRAALPYLGIAAVPFAVAGVFLAMGAGYVLDDWYLRANAHFDGVLATGGDHAGQRPGAVPLWGLVFGPWGGRPVPAVLLNAVAGSTFAVCVALLLRRVMPQPVAVAVALVWAFLPTHTSQEVWVTCVNIAWSQAAVAVGLVVGWRTPRRWWHLAVTAACFLFAVLAYEATVVVAMLAVLVLPWLERRRLDWPLVAAAGGSALVGLAWVATHWFKAKQPGQRLAAVQDVFVANSAWGFVAPGRTAKLLGVAALALFAVAVGRLVLPSFRRHCGLAEWLMVAGMGVMVAGTIPFSLYVYEPLGAGDRTNGLSAVGGALFLVGAGCLVARVSRPALVAVCLVAVVSAGATRAERLWLWHLAGRDADAILDAAVARIPDPDATIVFGPEPISRSKIVAFLERSSIASGAQLAYDDRTVQADLTRRRAAFLAAPERLRIDIRPLSRLDDR